MGIAAAPGTHFMQSLIRNRDLQGSRLIRNGEKKATPKRLRDINIKTDTGKFTLGSI